MGEQSFTNTCLTIQWYGDRCRVCGHRCVVKRQGMLTLDVSTQNSQYYGHVLRGNLRVVGTGKHL